MFLLEKVKEISRHLRARRASGPGSSISTISILFPQEMLSSQDLLLRGAELLPNLRTHGCDSVLMLSLQNLCATLSWSRLYGEDFNKYKVALDQC